MDSVERFGFEFEIGKRIRETTHWFDSVRTFENVETHLVIKRSDGREHHLYGDQADSVICALDLRSALTTPRLGSAKLGVSQ
jgi:predicted YcjX-like family ATPase